MTSHRFPVISFRVYNRCKGCLYNFSHLLSHSYKICHLNDLRSAFLGKRPLQISFFMAFACVIPPSREMTRGIKAKMYQGQEERTKRGGKREYMKSDEKEDKTEK